MLKLLKPDTKENVRENNEEETRKRIEKLYTPTRSVRINSAQNNDPCNSRNLVTGVLNDSTNQPKRPKIRSQSQPASKERTTVARTLFAPDKNDGVVLPMPKALTASLATFDGKSEKFELFEDLVRKIIKMYPHLTELQKKFHSLLRGDALQAFCNIEDSKKDSLDEIMTIFKRRFGDYLSMAKKDVSGTHSSSTSQHKNSTNFWTHSKKPQRKPSEPKPNYLLTKIYTPKFPTMLRKYLTGRTLKTRRITTSCFTWKEKCALTVLEHQMR